MQLRSKADDAEVEKLVGKLPKAGDFPVVLSDSGTVYKPNGERLLTMVRGGISEAAAEAAYPFFHSIRKQTAKNRGNFSGEPRYQYIKKDGKASGTNFAKEVASCVLGSLDRFPPRTAFCRQTYITRDDPEGWKSCWAFIQDAARCFEREVPKRYAAQLEAAQKTHPAYVIPGTPFTTATVNNCTQGGYHRDAGDYKPGFGVMPVLRRGSYRGCLLGFPAYGVAVDLQDRDLILFDPHEVHGNTPYEDAIGPKGEPDKGGYERISVVLYFRSKMTECLSPTEELTRIKAHRGAIDT